MSDIPVGLFERTRWVGARVKRREDPALLTGSARFVADLDIRGVVEAVFVRSQIAHGHLRGIDMSAAVASPDVVAVFTADDFDVAPIIDILEIEGLHKTPRPALSSGRVRFVGDPVALVVASDRYTAEDAADTVVLEIDDLPPVIDARAALDADAPKLFDELDDNTFLRLERRAGDVDGAFARADFVFRDSFHTNRYIAAPMETRGCVASFDHTTGHLTFWASTQCPHLWRSALAQCLHIPERDVRVITPEVGGGFGLKAPIYPEDLAIAAASMKLGRPVRWIEDRREHLISAAHAKEQHIDFEVATTRDGVILGVRARFIGDTGAYSFGPYGGLLEPLAAATSLPGPYAIDNYDYEVVGALTTKTPIYAYRGIGWSAAQTVREVFFDDIARELGIDRREFRLKNMLRSDELPKKICTGITLDSGSYVDSTELALRTLDYEGFAQRQAAARAEGRYIGIGVSPFVESTAWGTAASHESGFPGSTHDNATVTIDPSGSVTVAVSVAPHGQGHKTSLAQLAADMLGVEFDDVRVLAGDTDVSPYGMGTFASRSAVVGGGAVTLAAIDVREKVQRVAADMLEANPLDIELASGRVFVKGTPDRGLSLSEVAGAAYFAPELRRANETPLLSATQFYDPPATYSNGCVAVIVEVDITTGLVKLERVVAVEDCGTVLNPTIVEGQVRGGIAQGIGGVLYEELPYDDAGQPLATTYLDYLLPTAVEVPPIEVLHIETPSPFTIGGMKGMAEGSSIAAPAAVVNAVADALQPFNPRIRALPLTPTRLLDIVNADGE
jgi:carbon-monoxide dehydrogenase large subunit